MSTEVVVERLLGEEGGVADVGDGQGVTRWGQTAGWLARHRLPTPQDRAQAADNYRRWLAEMHVDKICDFDTTLGSLVADWEINSGDGVGIQHLQRLLRVADDGIIGPKTLAALDSHRAMTHELCVMIVASRSRFFGDVLRRPDRVQFAHSWLNRLADLIELL